MVVVDVPVMAGQRSHWRQNAAVFRSSLAVVTFWTGGFALNVGLVQSADHALKAL